MTTTKGQEPHVSKTPDDGGPAFPVDKFDYDNATTYGGLTKREYFAAMAMQNLISSVSLDGQRQQRTWDGCANLAVKYADALLAELKKGSGE